MAKFTITFHPLFILFSFLLVYFGWFEEFLIYFIVLCLHEYAHYYVAKKLGYTLNKVVFMPYGAGLGGKNQIILPKHEILIALAGPLLNIIFVIICVCLWWIFPASYAYTTDFVLSNLSLAIFNILPVFPLDGGRVIVGLLSNKIKRRKVYSFMKITGVFFSVLFCILFLFSVFTKVNLTFFFVAVFLFTSCFGNDSNIYFERTQIHNFNKNITEPIETRMYVIDHKTPIYKLVKNINSGYFTIFYMMDKNKIVKVVTENDVLNLVQKN